MNRITNRNGAEEASTGARRDAKRANWTEKLLARETRLNNGVEYFSGLLRLMGPFCGGRPRVKGCEKFFSLVLQRLISP